MKPYTDEGSRQNPHSHCLSDTPFPTPDSLEEVALWDPLSPERGHHGSVASLPHFPLCEHLPSVCNCAHVQLYIMGGLASRVL